MNKLKKENLLFKEFTKLGHKLWTISLKNIDKKQLNQLISILIANNIYDFSISKIGTQELYDYYYEN